jgi:hypothetical protein
MAIRFYLSSFDGVPDGIAPAFAAWSRTTEEVRSRMMPFPTDDSPLVTKTIWANGAAAADESAIAVQFISDRLAAGHVFSTSDTFKCYIRCAESAANDNINRQPICVKIVSEDGGTIRQTLFGLAHAGPNTTEWNTSLRNKTFADGDALTAGYTTVEGDRLVVEVGGQVSSAGGSTVTGSMSFGTAPSADLAEDEVDTGADKPWFALPTLTLTFAPPSPSAVFCQAAQRAANW